MTLIKKISTYILYICLIGTVIWTLYSLNSNFHDNVINSKQLEAIHIASNIIHNQNQDPHLTHDHSKNHNVHLVHDSSDAHFNINSSKLHNIIRFTVSDLRIDGLRLIDIKGNIIYSTIIDDDIKINNSDLIHVIRTKQPLSNIVHSKKASTLSNIFSHGYKRGYNTDTRLFDHTIVETYVPILI